MRINLHIEQLVLEGLPVGSHQGPLVQAAVEAELARLLAESGFEGGVPQGRTTPLLRAEAIGVEGSASGLGARIGQAIHGEIRK